MKKAVFIFGPHAVGKMTVGQSIAKKTGLRLFHNHMSIEPFLDLFADMPKERAEITNIVREEVFKLFAQSDQYGLVFTFIWYFDDPAHIKDIDRIEKIFTDKGCDVIFVELEADIETRLERNVTPNRLAQKPSKRDLKLSFNLIETKESRHRVNSHAGEVKKDNYIKINNSSLSPDQVASLVIDKFKL